MFRVALRDIERGLQQVKPNADEGPVDKSIAHIIELSPQKSEEKHHAKRFRRLFHTRGR